MDSFFIGNWCGKNLWTITLACKKKFPTKNIWDKLYLDFVKKNQSIFFNHLFHLHHLITHLISPLRRRFLSRQKVSVWPSFNSGQRSDKIWPLMTPFPVTLLLWKVASRISKGWRDSKRIQLRRWEEPGVTWTAMWGENWANRVLIQMIGKW